MHSLNCKNHTEHWNKQKMMTSFLDSIHMVFHCDFTRTPLGLHKTKKTNKLIFTVKQISFILLAVGVSGLASIDYPLSFLFILPWKTSFGYRTNYTMNYMSTQDNMHIIKQKIQRRFLMNLPVSYRGTFLLFTLLFITQK